VDGELEGGRPNQIFRNGNLVIRPASRWTPAVHQLLMHLKQARFLGAPFPLGFNERGDEQVSFVEGDVHGGLESDDSRSEQALKSAGKLLRRYHDAPRYFLNANTLNLPWMFPARQPVEVMCHGDFAPYNVTHRGAEIVGLFDFDTAHPAPRIWDVAYAVYRWAPLTGAHNSETFGTLEEKIGRAKLFCVAYRLSAEDWDQLVPMVITRLNGLIEHMYVQAAAGNETFAAHIRDGHDQLYKGDIEFVLANQKLIHEGIR